MPIAENKEERSVKQVLVVRKDLNMRSGKIASQCSHASLGAILKLMDITSHDGYEKRSLYLYYDEPIAKWIHESFTKICVYVNSEKELIDIYNQAKLAKINTVMIEDNGLTEFHGVKTKTCVCIGPYWSESIDLITGHLKLL